tara:strand:- start:125 stop:1606 length:1482 start_codon:yes stop_codon:yes gene_type:complete
MALPIQPTNTQAGCNPVSSNCVIWQGPDIPCITLCRGDSISDVTYKVATELCTLVDQLDLVNFNVSCFPPICPKPENITDLIQFILDQLCDLQTGTTPAGTAKSLVGSSTTSCEDVFACQITVATCFQYTNSFGDLVTQMSLTEYATAIANRVCDILDDITTINATLITLSNRIEVFEDCDACNPVIPPIEIPTSCLSAETNIPIETFVEDLETAFCALQTATGNPTEIAGAIAQQCINLDTTPTINNAAVTYNALPGWVNAGSYNTMADAINNMWITICDIRTAVQSVVTNCCNPTCADVDITMTSSFTSPNLSLVFNGTAPGFSDCYPAGMYVTVTDAYGVSYVDQVSVIPNLGAGAQLIDLTSSGLNLFTNFTVQLNICADSAGLKCNDTIIQTVENTALCPAMTYAADVTYIDYTFTNPLSSPVTYIIECWNSGLTAIIASSSEVNPAAGAVTGSITGLTAAVTYKLRIRTIIGSTITDCPYTSVTTKP